MAGIQLSGLGSGFDWKSVVDQLMTVEAAPITRLQTEQSTNSDMSSALSTLETKLQALQTSATALNSTSLYAKRSTTSSTSGSTWTTSAADNTVAGAYKFSVTQLASASVWYGGGDVGKALDSTGTYPSASVSTLMSSLPTGVAVTAGNFTVNGNTVDVALTDSLDTVLGKISTATGGAVTGTYNNLTDKIELTSSTPGTKIVLGASNDSSNFLTAMHLSNNDSDSVISSSALGTLTASATLKNSRLSSTLTDPSGDGSGSFTINGVSISYNSQTDSLNSVISNINASSAGVVATYDSVNDRVILTNKNTGDIGFSVKDVKGSLMTALKLTNSQGTLQAGKNALFTLNDGGTLSSTTNTLDSSVHGITGLTITANSTTTETITVSNDTTSVKAALDDYIAKYNDAQSYIDSQTKITTSNGKVSTSTLSSNREVQSWATTLRRLTFGTVSGITTSIKSMDDLGIGFTSEDGTLSVTDSAKLSSALATSSSDVTNFFTNSSNNFTTAISTFMKNTVGDSSLGTKGSLDKQITSLSDANTSLDKQIADIQRQLEEKRSQLESAFIAMDSAQSDATNIMKQLSRI